MFQWGEVGFFGEAVADGCRREEGPLVGMGETGRTVVTSVQFQ